jgi:nucleoside-diphosphate-sugar epimerase
MPAAQPVQVVLGATSGLARALVAELVRHRYRVRAVSRSRTGPWPTGVEVVRADITRSEDARMACRDAAVVYHTANMACTGQEGDLSTMADSVIAAAADADAVLVVADDLSMYGPTSNLITEETPPHPASRNGQIRADLEERFLAAHRTGRAGVAIGRGSDCYGPHARSAINQLVFDAILQGRPATWPGSLDVPHTLTYLPDFVAGLMTLGEHARAWGEIWHIPSGTAVTGRAFIIEVYRELGRPPKIRRLGRWRLSVAGLFNRRIRELSPILPRFEQPFVMDASKFERTFGVGAIRVSESIRETLSWLAAPPL